MVLSFYTIFHIKKYYKYDFLNDLKYGQLAEYFHQLFISLVVFKVKICSIVRKFYLTGPIIFYDFVNPKKEVVKCQIFWGMVAGSESEAPCRCRVRGPGVQLVREYFLLILQNDWSSQVHQRQCATQENIFQVQG